MAAYPKRGVPLLIVAGLIAAAIWITETTSTRALTVHHALPVQALVTPALPNAAGDGARLAHIDGCLGCHGPRLTGRAVFTGWLGARLVAPNLTRLAHHRTDAQLAAAIRFGVKPDGTSVVAMPARQLIKSSDSDIAAIIAYLRTLPQKPDTGGKTRWRFGGRVMLALGLLPVEAAAVNPAARGPLRTPASPVALGHYLTQAHCSVCHGRDLSGETMESSPGLRMAIQHYSPAAFAHFFRTGQGQIGHGTDTMTVMIRRRFRYLTPAEVQAIYAYLISDNRPG